MFDRLTTTDPKIAVEEWLEHFQNDENVISFKHWDRQIREVLANAMHENVKSRRLTTLQPGSMVLVHEVFMGKIKNTQFTVVESDRPGFLKTFPPGVRNADTRPSYFSLDFGIDSRGIDMGWVTCA